jgi:hypothetical protein
MTKNNYFLINCIILLILIIIISNLNNLLFGINNLSFGINNLSFGTNKSSFGKITTNFYLGNSVINNNDFPSLKYTYEKISGKYPTQSLGLTNNDNINSLVLSFPEKQSTNPAGGINGDDDRIKFCKQYLYMDFPNGNIANNVIVTCYDIINQKLINLNNNVIGNLNMFSETEKIDNGIDNNYTLSVVGNNNSFSFLENENGNYLIIIGLQNQVPFKPWYPTIYLYKTPGLNEAMCAAKTSINGRIDVSDCESTSNSNIIDRKECRGCIINLQLNGKQPSIELPLLKVYNGVPIYDKDGSTIFNPNFVNDKGELCYLIPTLLSLEKSIGFNGKPSMQFSIFMEKIKVPKNSYISSSYISSSYISRIDNVPQIDNFMVVYYTTLNEDLTYFSDGAFIIDITNFTISGDIVTNTDSKNKLSDQYLNVSWGKSSMGSAPGVNIQIPIPNSKTTINTDANINPPFDFNFLRIYYKAFKLNTITIKSYSQTSVYGMDNSFDIGPYLFNKDLRNIYFYVDFCGLMSTSLIVTLFDSKKNVLDKFSKTC